MSWGDEIMERFYINMLNYIHSKNALKKSILFINKYLPYVMYAFYPLLMLYLFIIKYPLFLDTLLRPLIAFATVTIIRKLINRKRPYEYMNIKPLVGHKLGQSFPSRHTLSAMIIALVTLNIHLGLGIFMIVLASIIGLCRILAGVHHISDVIAGALYALIVYLI